MSQELVSDVRNVETESTIAAPAPTDAPSKSSDAVGQHGLLVVIIPALNESATIGRVVEAVPRAISGFARVEVVVIDDGSTDDTVQLARAAGAHVVSHGSNRGVGAAFATGIDAALSRGADVIVNMDGDGQFTPSDITELVRPITEQGYGFVTCSRFGNPEYIPVMPGIKKWGNRMMCHLINRIIWNAKFTDVSCGFRAYTRETALRLSLFGSFTYTQESFIDLAAKNIRMTEVPLKVRGVREFGKSRVASNLWKYAFETVPIILRAMRDVRPLKFFGSIGIGFFTIGFALLAFVSVWWLATSHTSPWTSFITIGSANFLLGVVVSILALVADQLGRVRALQSEVLFFERLRHYAEIVKNSSAKVSESDTEEDV